MQGGRKPEGERHGAARRQAPGRRPRAPQHRPPAAPPPELAARILALTDTVLILDKPAGLPVHAARPGRPSVTDWLPLLRFGKRRDPQPAHRLDADTAGCLVLGRTKPALAELGAAFAGRRVEKRYWAVVRGGPLAGSGVIELPLAKTSSAATGWRMRADPAGQPARTTWRVLARGAETTLLELTPETGRTHQLRVHCAASGWPILGDALYGPRGEAGPLHLLARFVAVPGASATAPVPEALAPGFRAAGWAGHDEAAQRVLPGARRGGVPER
ncbi:MAG: RluA family pseudouridine synthase [Acetobacteraceae bacterium]